MWFALLADLLFDSILACACRKFMASQQHLRPEAAEEAAGGSIAGWVTASVILQETMTA